MTQHFLRRPFRAAYFVLIGAMLWTSCEKPEDSLGLGLQPDEEFINLVTIDSLHVDSYTVLADSTRTNQLSRALIGDLSHPTFGNTQSTLYSQVRLSSLSNDFQGDGNAEDVVLDSLVLSMVYFEGDSLYGLSEPMQFSVKRLDEALDLDSVYYSNYSTAVQGTELLHSTVGPISPAQNDSTELYGDMYPAQLRLRLSDDLGDELLAEGLAEASSFDDVDDFLEFFKGIQVTGTNLGATGSILSFDLIDAQSRMTLYYKNGVEDSLSFNFLINSSAQRYLAFDHDYVGTSIDAQIMDPSLGQQELFIHSMAGVNVQLDFPSLVSYTDTIQSAFNKAEIVIPVADIMEDEEFPFPDRLFAVYIDSDGDVISIPDIFEGETHSDGFYDEDNGEYRINITRFAQQVVTGIIDSPELRLLPTSNSIRPHFVRMLGTEGLMAQAKLVLTYTEYE